MGERYHLTCLGYHLTCLDVPCPLDIIIYIKERERNKEGEKQREEGRIFVFTSPFRALILIYCTEGIVQSCVLYSNTNFLYVN